MKRTLVVLVAMVLVGGCDSVLEEGTATPELTEQYSCGYGFYASNAEQTAGLVIDLADHEAARNGDVPEVSQLDEGPWNARLEFGTDLFANWCDDVLEPGEPTPEVDETWEVSGTISIEELPASGQGLASATLTGVEAHGPDGQLIVFDDFVIVNQFWGTFAG